MRTALADVERLYIERVLNQVSGNKALAAKILKISRTSLYRILDEPNRQKMGEDLKRGVPVAGSL